MTNSKMKALNSRQKIVILQLLIILTLVCVGIYISQSGQDSDVYAETTSEECYLDSPYYEGSTFHFDSELNVSFTNYYGVLLGEQSFAYYTNATYVNVIWREEGENNFNGAHNMGIKGKIELKNVSNVTDFSDDNALNNLPDMLGLYTVSYTHLRAH